MIGAGLMQSDRRRKVGRSLAVLLAAALALLANTVVYAEGETIEVSSASITSEFPDGFRIKVEAAGENEIKSIAVRLKVGQQTSVVYEYLCQAADVEGLDWRCEDFEPAQVVTGEFFWRTNTSPRFIPPGTIIYYNFEIEDSEGTVLETERQEFIYYDARFEWSEVSEGPVTVAYHGPVKTRAEKILEAILDTMDKMGDVLGADIKQPIRVTAYNTTRDMLDALPPGSTTIRRELITEGQAFTNIGTLLVLQGGRLSLGTASHEVTHILVHRAGDGVFRRVPPWLNEGLAEYANVDPSYSYDVAVEFAAATGRLLPVVYMDGLPGIPEDVIIFYGQSSDIVELMLDGFGPEKMAELMATLKSGKNVDEALERVYGFDRRGLDDMWRDSIGAARYIPPEPGAARPTPLPRREILPYSLTPHPQAETVGAKSDMATPTPEPEPVAIAAAGSGGCSAPVAGVSGPLDVTAGGFLLGLAGLGLRRRVRKR